MEKNSWSKRSVVWRKFKKLLFLWISIGIAICITYRWLTNLHMPRMCVKTKELQLIITPSHRTSDTLPLYITLVKNLYFWRKIIFFKGGSFSYWRSWYTEVYDSGFQNSTLSLRMTILCTFWCSALLFQNYDPKDVTIVV